MIAPITASVAITAIIVAILTHIKHSSCLGAEIDTRTPTLTNPPAPKNTLQTTI